MESETTNVPGADLVIAVEDDTAAQWLIYLSPFFFWGSVSLITAGIWLLA